MNLNERIREVRKDAKLNQTEFGERLGVSRSVIANIELDLNKTGVPDNIIKLICLTFNINEDWLRTGKGEMKVETSESLLEKVKNTYQLSNLEFALLEEYLKLDKAQRAAFEDFLDNILNPEPPESVTQEIQEDANEDEYIDDVAARSGKLNKLPDSKLIDIDIQNADEDDFL